ncbi:MAG: hypothetical protein ACRCZI_05155 [Cetobacterium sp.]
MKKLLLAAILVVGSMATYAQTNKVIVPLTEGKAEAILPVSVKGEIFDKNVLSLVVEVASAQNADGSGFALAMQNAFLGDKADVDGVSGEFHAYLVSGDKEVAFTKKPTVGLLKGAEAATNEIKDSTTTGTASEGVKVNYNLMEKTYTANKYTGSIAAKATTSAATKVGTYADNSVRLSVAVDGQADPTK